MTGKGRREAAKQEQLRAATPLFRADRLTTQTGIDPREAFLLTRCDGNLNVTQLAAATGMEAAEALRILIRMTEMGLVHSGVLEAHIKEQAIAQAQAQAGAPEADIVEDDVASEPRGTTPPSDPKVETLASGWSGTWSGSVASSQVLSQVHQAPQLTTSGTHVVPGARPPEPDPEARQSLVRQIAEQTAQAVQRGSGARGAGYRSVSAHGTPRNPNAQRWRETFTTLPLDGDLAEEPFYRLMLHLLSFRLDGVVHISMNRRRKSIYFQEGYPIYVSSNLVSETLGSLLVRSGKLTEADRDESHKRARREGRLQGELLVEMGRLSRRELEVALRWQATVKVLNVFGWRDGRYRFDGDADVSRIFRVQINLPELLFRGMRKYTPSHSADEWMQTRLDLVPRATQGELGFDLRDLRLGKAEARLLEAVQEQPRRLREIYAISPMLRGATSLLLWTVTELGLFEWVPAADAEADTALTGAELGRTLRRFESANHFEVLQAHPISDGPDLLKARDRELRRFDAGRLEGGGTAAEKDAVARIQKRVHAAYKAVEDEDVRRRYRREVIDADRLGLFAELQFRKGEVALFWKQQFELAIKLFSSAAELDPRNGGYVAHQGLALMRAGAGRDGRQVRRGQQLIERGMSISPDSARPFMCMGLALKDRGDEAGAAAFFQKALSAENDAAAVRNFIQELGRATGKV